MLPQSTQNFAFPPTSTNDLSKEKVFSILLFHTPATLLLIAITGYITPMVLAAPMNSKFLLIILYSCSSIRS